MKGKVILTNKRDSIITSNLLNKKLFVYNGKTHVYVKVNKTLLGKSLGALSVTKKLGKSIHDSLKNRKKKKKNKSKK
jgi:ribosomal protein S19